MSIIAFNCLEGESVIAMQADLKVRLYVPVATDTESPGRTVPGSTTDA